ncbi:PIN domain-containing protein [Mongoliibacter ruber]|uniref:PIN domain-containing protein n=1 Tax=Mongoliibacter ruber TaxID=1750599 RepID=A0A2T0WCS6_9BACT|nr:PIN domain-containing protein [Mongoliibacter ruber]PRY84475.1 PIN domain-containing protein [Mongoliibacter ruber]
MNIFIDSNILYQDYFFENKSNKKLLEYCDEGLLTLYMSEIVRLELRRQFQKEIEEKNKEIKKVIKDAKRLKIDCIIAEIPTEIQLGKFDKFYQRLELYDNFHILPYKNEFLPDIVDKAINRKKPFTEEKSELKDAIIWKTYASFAETNNTFDCILLTNNTSDFCSKKDKSKIHPDLILDSNKFSVVNKSFDFIKLYASTLESSENIFQAYISQIEINEDSVLEIIVNNFEKQIEERMHQKVDTLHPSDILDADCFFDGQLSSYDCEILQCEDVDYDILSDTALISGILYASCYTEILEYNPVRDQGEDIYSIVGEKYLTFKIYFNFDMERDDIYSDFEITDIELSNEN